MSRFHHWAERRTGLIFGRYRTHGKYARPWLVVDPWSVEDDRVFSIVVKGRGFYLGRALAPHTAPLTPEQPPADHGGGSGAGGGAEGEGGK